MECWPSLFPESFSRRLPGGTRRSFTSSALFNSTSFLKAFRCRFDGSAFDLPRSQTLAVSFSRKPFIIDPMITRNVNHVNRD